MSYLNDVGKRALYHLKVIDTKNKIINSELGYAFVMEDLSTKELLLVSSTSVLTALKQLPRFSTSSNIEIQAERYYKPKDKPTRVFTIDPDKLQIENSSVQGISFVRNFEELCTEVKPNYKFKFACSRDPLEAFKKNPIMGYAFKNKEIINFELSSNGIAYEVSTISDKEFALERARGAPIVLKLFDNQDSNEVVGLLEFKDGQCYPLLFNIDTFTLTSMTGECSGVNVSGGSDKTDSNTSSSNKGPNENDEPVLSNDGHSADGVTTKAVQPEEKPPKTDAIPVPKPTPPVLPVSQVPPQGSKMVSGLQKHKGTCNNQLASDTIKCIKSYTLADAPKGYQLKAKLVATLDPKMPFCNDYRELAGEFGYSNQEIELFSSKESPTQVLLSGLQGKGITIEELYNKLSFRDDVVLEMDKWMQGCKCEECVSSIQ